MCEFLVKHDSFVGFLLTLYFLIIPMLCNMAWQDTKTSYIKWYFTKSIWVNYLGFSIFLIIGSGSFVWYIMLVILELLVYIVISPILWLLEFIFFNKDCSSIISEELIEKERQREERRKNKEYRANLTRHIKENQMQQFRKELE